MCFAPLRHFKLPRLYKPNMSLLALPQELLLHAASFIQSELVLSCLARCCHYLYERICPALFQRNAKLNGSSALTWGVRKNLPNIIRRAISFGIDPTVMQKMNVVTDAIVRNHYDMLEFLFTECHLKPISTGSGDSPMWLAINHRLPSVVKVLLKHGASFEAAPGDSTPLHSMARYGHVEFAEMLLRDGADVGAADDNGDTPVHAAADRDSVTMVTMFELLVKHGGDLNHRNLKDETPLGVAISNHKFEVAQWMLRNCANVHSTRVEGQPALHWMADFGQDEFAKLLLDHGIDPDKSLPLDWPIDGADGHVDGERSQDVLTNTPLILAATKGHTQIVKMLVAAGANINGKGIHGTTALLSAATTAPLELTEVLLANGADPKHVDDHGHTAAMFAVNNRDIKLLERLLEAGVDIEPSCMHGHTPLLTAAWSANLTAIKTLLAYGADITAKDAWGWQAVMVAAMIGDPEGLDYLLSKDTFDINEQDPDGRTALYHAAKAGKHECVAALLSREPRASPNIKDRYGATPLLVAARNGHSEVIRALVSEPDISICDVDLFGYNASHWATKCGDPDTEKLLERYFEDAESAAADSDRIPLAHFQENRCFCDVCGRSTIHDPHGQARVCKVCVDDDAGFLICHPCLSQGAACRDASHELELHSCTCGADEDEDTGSPASSDEHSEPESDDDEDASEEEDDEEE